jgi:histidine ammonia-lyase
VTTAASAPPDTVRIGLDPLRVDDIVRIADGARVALMPDAESLILASRQVVEEHLAQPEPVYGLNTGLGHMRNERMPADALAAYQVAIVRLHEGAIGRPLPTRIVRAAMAVRLAGIARGGSGMTLVAARTLAAMLDAAVHPIVPEYGSVGASDLMSMACIARVMIGEGAAEYEGERLSGAEAMRRAGIPVIVLEAKEGLASISANGVSIGHGALVIARAARVAAAADLVVAATMEALGANPSIIDPAVASAKPIPGQVDAAAHLRRLLRGSAILEPGAAQSVQDPLSIRVVPQVHGALRELGRFTHEAVEGELAAMDDNPLVVVDEGRMISNGNFHPMLMALAFDALRPALAHVGQLSDRRMNQVWQRLFTTDIDMAQVMEYAVQQGTGFLSRYAAASRAADLRQMAAPATLDIGALDLGVEDHSTAAPITVRRTEDALDALETILLVELLTARDGFAIVGRHEPLGAGVAAAMRVIDRACQAGPPQATSTMGADLHAMLLPLLTTTILDAADAA